MRKILRWFVVPAMTIGLLAGAAYGAEEFHSNYSLYWISTGSMAPSIKPDSLVIVHKHHFAPGNVIAFRVDGQTIVHRLRKFRSDGTTLTKGDNNPTVDPWSVPKTAIIGNAVGVVVVAGWARKLVRSPLGFVFDFSVLGLIICIFWPKRKPEPLPNPGQ